MITKAISYITSGVLLAALVFSPIKEYVQSTNQVAVSPEYSQLSTQATLAKKQRTKQIKARQKLNKQRQFKLNKALSDTKVQEVLSMYGNPKVEMDDFRSSEVITTCYGISLDDDLNISEMKSAIVKKAPQYAKLVRQKELFEEKVELAQGLLDSLQSDPAIQEKLELYGNPRLICSNMQGITTPHAYSMSIRFTSNMTFQEMNDGLDSLLAEHVIAKSAEKEEQEKITKAEKLYSEVKSDKSIQRLLEDYGNPDVGITNFSSLKSLASEYGISLDSDLNKAEMRTELVRQVGVYAAIKNL